MAEGGAVCRSDLYRVVPHRCRQKPHETAPCGSSGTGTGGGPGWSLGRPEVQGGRGVDRGAGGGAILTLTRMQLTRNRTTVPPRYSFLIRVAEVPRELAQPAFV
ncbi:hypothetical protein KM043_011194 [Ampulex compressa]|nr:hypothetical protein KM043_011194 [Ampulex compressa]